MTEPVFVPPIAQPRGWRLPPGGVLVPWASPAVLVGGLIVVTTLIVTAAAPLVAPYDPSASDLESANAPPWLFGGTSEHVFGTDPLGRDLLSRIVYGVRTSLLLSIAAVGLAVGIGLVVGLVAGYFGRFVDAVLMRLTDVQLGFPFILLAVMVLSVSRPSAITLIIVLSLAAWPIYARVIRSIMLSEKESDYVLAGIAIGASHSRIILRYVGRPIMRSLVGIATFDIANMVTFEAMLGFIALGLQPPTISLGNILADGKGYLFSGFWWTVTVPGLVILVILLGVNLLADGLHQKAAERG